MGISQVAEPGDPWEGLRDARNFGEPCPQPNLFTRIGEGSEDCLFLNVYTPAAVGSLKIFPFTIYIPAGMCTHIF